MRQLSDHTVAAQLAARIKATKLFQLFVRQLGPRDVWYVSAFAIDASGNVRELKATAADPLEAFEQLFRNLDAGAASE